MARSIIKNKYWEAINRIYQVSDLKSLSRPFGFLELKKADEQPLLLLVDTTIEGASPSHACQEYLHLGSAPYFEKHEMISYF